MNKILSLIADFFSSAAVTEMMTDSFQQLMAQHGLKFDLSDNAAMARVDIVDNRNMPYHFAYKHHSENFEVRYHVQNFSDVSERSAKSLLMATTMNISGGNFETMTPFPTEAVKKEFGADWGMMSSVALQESEFSKGYTQAMVILIRKENHAAYIFYMMDDDTLARFPSLSTAVFTALRFK